MSRLLHVVLVLLAVAACKKQDATPRPLAPLPDDGTGTASAQPPDPTPPPSQMSDAEFDKLMNDVVGYIGKMRDVVVAAGGDCSKMATGLEQVAAENRDVIERTRALDEDASAEDRADAWMKAHEGEVAPMFEALFQGLGPCQEDPAVQSAMEKMGT
ncbi:MAG: hypothetical protein K8M05_11280 [Deltaproteobacteria bacterium]|nr:hypothetical protein [Kofleriaceae bacterium]